MLVVVIPTSPRSSKTEFGCPRYCCFRIGVSADFWGAEVPDFRPEIPALHKEQNENGHIFCIRTPFSMILGSLESQRKALQDHDEKNHCPSWYYKSKWGKVKDPFCKPKKPNLLQMKSEWNKTNFVGKRTTNAILGNGKQAMEILQRNGREKSSARMNRQNLQYRKRNRRRIRKPFLVNLALSHQDHTTIRGK